MQKSSRIKSKSWIFHAAIIYSPKEEQRKQWWERVRKSNCRDPCGIEKAHRRVGLRSRDRTPHACGELVHIPLSERFSAAHERHHVAGALSASGEISSRPARCGGVSSDGDAVAVRGHIPPHRLQRSALRRGKNKISQDDRSAVERRGGAQASPERFGRVSGTKSAQTSPTSSSTMKKMKMFRYAAGG